MKSKDKLMQDTGTVLKMLRERKSKEDEMKLTQNELAEYAGMSVRYYNKLEKGKSIPTIDTLMKIAEAYKMTLSEICRMIEEC